MIIFFHKNFEKQYKKLQPKIREKVKERQKIFLADPFDPVLNNHKLQGKDSWLRSLDITGDYRLHYETISDDRVLFRAIGTHHELYGS
mgnify:FL=1